MFSPEVPAPMMMTSYVSCAAAVGSIFSAVAVGLPGAGVVPDVAAPSVAAPSGVALAAPAVPCGPAVGFCGARAAAAPVLLSPRLFFMFVS